MRFFEGRVRCQFLLFLVIAAPLFFHTNILTQPAFSQAADNETTTAEFRSDAGLATFYLKVTNAETGLAIPRLMTVNIDKMGMAAREQPSISRWELPVGPHTLEVSADGFLPMTVNLNLEEGPNAQMEVELEPENPTEALLVPDNKAVLSGTVSDAVTGEPIDKARITLADSRDSLETTASGTFRFEVTTGKATDVRRPAASLEVQADGYQALRLRNLPLAPGGTARIPIRLDRKTSGTADIMESNEWTQPGGNMANEWVFDVSAR